MKPTNFTQNAKRAMKHFSFFIFLFSFAFALASCTKTEEAPTLPQSGDQSVTFTIAPPAETRAPTTIALSRYVMEAYEGNDLATTPLRVEAAVGSLILELKKNTNYTFVFWADNGTANSPIATSGDYYDATSLQEVKINPAAYAATVATPPAYCLAMSLNSKDFEPNKTITLKNATAQLNFVEAAGLETAGNSLTVKYSSDGKLNVAKGTITENETEISRTYSNITQTANGGVVATDYILAPLVEKRLLTLKVTFNSEPEKTITAVPFQQSYKTNVKGEFSNFYASLFTVSNQVEDYVNNPDEVFSPVQIGDFYYSDNTFSSIFNTTKKCIGIVYIVNSDGKTGKIVSLDENSARWSAEGVMTNTLATSKTDGTDNTAKVLNMPNRSDYPAFEWCDDKNKNAITGIHWYIPAQKELVALYGTGGATMTAVNISLKSAGATQLVANRYWSSTQDLNDSAFYVVFVSGVTERGTKHSTCNVRVVSAF